MNTMVGTGGLHISEPRVRYHTDGALLSSLAFFHPGNPAVPSAVVGEGAAFLLPEVITHRRGTVSGGTFREGHVYAEPRTPIL